MTQDQITLLLVAGATVGLFLWGRWRHDLVALASLLGCVLLGLVPPDEAFAGFGHPAVITVACVLVLSRGLQATGVVDALAQRFLPSQGGPTLAIASLTGVGLLLSAFINNVGAMALLLPIAVQLAARHGLPPGKILMPLSFGTILGGMTTLIGTPPNLIVSAFRAESGGESFGMFDFTPVGLMVAAAGFLFVALLGWRIVPAREQRDASSFDTGTYLTEARVTGDGKAAGKTLREVEDKLEEADAQVIGLVRNELRVTAPSPRRLLREGDILVIEADPESLAAALSSVGLKLEEAVEASGPEDGGEEAQEEQASANQAAGNRTTGEDSPEKSDDRRTARRDAEVALQEFVVMPSSALVGRSASDIQLRTIHGLNLLAISRHGRRSIKRLRSTPLKAGDVLLMQGAPDALAGFAADSGFVPLARRAIRIPDKTRLATATAIMGIAIAGAAFGLMPAAIAFTAAVVAFMALGIVPARRVYEAIDWPVIVLLGALIPVATAMATTGTADVLAQGMLETVAQGRPVLALAILLVAAMTLSDFMNNAATAAVMCPIAISTAAQLGVSADSFLMAVAIGASCAFLTPIGHQNNTLILGPGGFRFGDYWRLGLPMELLVLAVGVPMLLWIWPL
jgi:di/tricarboxylate transporter